MADSPQTAKIISDIVEQMSSQSLDWYVNSVQFLAQVMNISYDQAHKLILQVRNQ